MAVHFRLMRKNRRKQPYFALSNAKPIVTNRWQGRLTRGFGHLHLPDRSVGGAATPLPDGSANGAMPQMSIIATNHKTSRQQQNRKNGTAREKKCMRGVCSVKIFT